jgi:hypothetical protein
VLQHGPWHGQNHAARPLTAVRPAAIWTFGPSIQLSTKNIENDIINEILNNEKEIVAFEVNIGCPSRKLLISHMNQSGHFARNKYS